MHSHLGGWSPDAKHTVDQLLRASANKGICGVAITDHYDIDSITEDGRHWTFDAKEYRRMHESLRHDPATPSQNALPGIMVGIELSYAQPHLEILKGLASDLSFDCVIVSLHAYDGVDPVTDIQDFYDDDIDKVYERVISAIADTAEDLPTANIIGHYDFFSRYSPWENTKLLYRHAPKAFDRLFRIMIRNGQALEINTGTVEVLHKKRGYRLSDAMPDEEIFKRYFQLGGRFITLGDDAHDTLAVGRMFRETAEWLKELGIDKCYYMQNRRWYEAPLSQ